jgi:uncharacterized protein (TIGR00369 family)
VGEARGLVSDDATDALAQFRSLTESVPFTRHLGIRIEEMKDGHARVRLAVSPELCNLAGSTVHGGVLAALVDVAGGAAIVSAAVQRPHFAGQTTVELNLSFLAPAPGSGELVAEGRVIRCGRTLGVAEGEVRAGDELVAKGRAVYRLIWD